MRRYLTDQGKADELAYWERRKAEYPTSASLPADAARRGYPDPPMYPWCNRLNAIRGVCTLQSCAGHHPSESGVPAGATLWHAQLWLWLSMDMAREFYSYGSCLWDRAPMERVSIFFMKDGCEIVDLIFHGNDRGVLEPSMSAIVRLFEDMANQVRSCLSGPGSLAMEDKDTQ